MYTAQAHAETQRLLENSKREYAKNLFVNRQPELSRIRELQSGERISTPVITLWGDNGIGKTWLLKRLAEDYSASPPRKNRPTFSLWWNFGENQFLTEIVKRLSQQTLEQLERQLEEKTKELLLQALQAGDITSFVNALIALSQTLTPIILFDSADNVDPALLLQTEEQIVKPLAQTEHVLLVFAGRRQLPKWTHYEVRQRTADEHLNHVTAFSMVQVKEQLELSGYPLPANWLYPITGGNPQWVDVYARRLRQLAQDEKSLVDENWLNQHRPDLTPLARAVVEQIEEQVSQTLRPALQAVWPLRYYMPDTLRFMLTESKLVEEIPTAFECWRWLQKIQVDSDVVWWDDRRKAYVTSDSARRLMNGRWLLEQPETYLLGHRRALNWFWEAAKNHAKQSASDMIEILFHSGSIYQVEGDQANLLENAQKVCTFIQSHLAEQLDQCIILQQALAPDKGKGDEELLEIMPEAVQKLLKDTLAHILGH